MDNQKELEKKQLELDRASAALQETKSNYYLLVSKIKEKEREKEQVQREFLKYKNETKEIIQNQNETIKILTEKLEEKGGPKNGNRNEKLEL